MFTGTLPAAAIRPCETDLVAVIEDYDGSAQLVMGECKSKGGEIDERDVENLKAVANMFEGSQRPETSRRWRWRGVVQYKVGIDGGLFCYQRESWSHTISMSAPKRSLTYGALRFPSKIL